MSRYSLEEQEQLASLKEFWAKYANVILIVLILIFSLFTLHYGWKWWQTRQSLASVQVYEQLQSAVSQGEGALVDQYQKILIENYPHSPYAQRGALLAAKVFFDQNKLDLAKNYLQWAVKGAKLNEYAATASLMLSAILIEQSDFQGAKAVLSKKYPGFEGLFHDRLGDLALIQQDVETAKKEYEAALSVIQAGSPWKVVIERKINHLPKKLGG